MNSTYAFILGRVYTLSILELIAVFSRLNLTHKILHISDQVAIVEFEAPLSPTLNLQTVLGGTIKIVKILEFVKKRPEDYLDFTLKNNFTPSKLKGLYGIKKTGKLSIGLSIYGLKDPKQFGQPARIAMQLKQRLSGIEISSRAVIPKKPSMALSSVTVKHNQLLEKGLELCLINAGKLVYIGKTTSIQAFEEYGKRDFARPVRDDKRGMIPPKLAQIMINLAATAKPGLIVDPLCGLGTISQEALLLGYKAFGSDIDPKATEGARVNLEWISNRLKLPKSSSTIFTSDAAKVSKTIKPILDKIKSEENLAVVTEGTLGPIYTSLPTKLEMQQNFSDLTQLYGLCFSDWKSFLPPKSRVVIAFPAYRTGENSYNLLPSLDFITTLGYNQVVINSGENPLFKRDLRFTERGTVIYDRKDQIVAREILIFQLSHK